LKRVRALIVIHRRFLKMRNGCGNQMSKINVKFVCSKMCGNFTLEEMKQARGDDPTLVCPRCGTCEWYLTPVDEAGDTIKNLKKYKER
jgi:predicted RNA-binding Zn-ribbon protein involved in translation (DUF1610 family)